MLVALLCMLNVSLSAQEQPPSVYVALEPAKVVMSTDQPEAMGVCGQIRLTFLWPSRDITLKMDPLQISIGAGLKVTRDGKPVQRRKPLREPKLIDVTIPHVDGLRDGIGMTFVCDVTARFDLDEPGIYQVTYEHPWPTDENVHFSAGAVTFAVVTPERLAELDQWLASDQEFAFACYIFRHADLYLEFQVPPHPSRHDVWKTIVSKGLLIGQEADAVLYALSSGATMRWPTGGLSDQWLYEFRGSGSYYVNFVDGKVVKLGLAVESDSP